MQSDTSHLLYQQLPENVLQLLQPSHVKTIDAAKEAARTFAGSHGKSASNCERLEQSVSI